MQCLQISFRKILRRIEIKTSSSQGRLLADVLQSGMVAGMFQNFNESNEFISIRNAFNVDRCTHRYLIETISESMHPKVMLACRYVSFYKSLVNSSKLCVRVMARLFQKDQRTVLGRTLGSLVYLCKTDNISLLTSNCIKKNLLYFPVPGGILSK